jgi:WD40 repeat protein
MARVFVSHASADRRVAADLHRLLVEFGHEVFLDTDRRDGIPVGEDWKQRLYAQLRSADAVVCAVSSSYAASQWCAIEIAVAQTLGARLIPLSVEPHVRHPLLRELQHLDYTADAALALAAADEALRGLAAAGGGGWPDGRSPFPGLRAFDAEWQRVFFGREREVAALAALLRSSAERAVGGIVTVVGPSGCGKSSLVRAGLLPAMAKEPGWSVLAPVLPGEDPVGALALELAAGAAHLGLPWSLGHVRAQLEDATGLAHLADELLVAASRQQRRRRLLLVVDQLEEMLTRASPLRRGDFARLLGCAAAGPVAVVATLRPEFLDPLLSDPTLAEVEVQPVTVRPLDSATLVEVIVKPARVARIGVDDILARRMVADTGAGEALPLLAFTLEQLAADVGPGGRLSAERYDRLGGVSGALAIQADKALQGARKLSGRSDPEVLSGLLRLVTVDEAGRPTSRRVPLDELPDPVRDELGAFIDRRLVTTDDSGDAVTVGVAHEAFLATWAPLAEAVTKAAAALRARRGLEHAAAEWTRHSRDPSYLYTGSLLETATDTATRIAADPARYPPLSAVERDFLQSSELVRRRRVRLRRTFTTSLIALVVCFAAAAVWALRASHNAAHQRDVAVSRQLIAQSETLGDSNPVIAKLESIAAWRIHPSDDARYAMLAAAARPGLATLSGHTSDVESVAFSPNGKTLASGSLDGSVRLWDVATRRPIGAPLAAHGGPVRSVAFGPGGKMLASGSFDGSVRLWDVASRRPIGAPLAAHGGDVRSVAFSRDGTLAVGSIDGLVRLWDVATRRPSGLPLRGHNNEVLSVAFSPNGKRLASGSVDDTVRLWNVATRPRTGATLKGHSGDVRSVAFSPDGETLASGSIDDTVRLWDVATRRPIGTPLTGHNGDVSSVAFSPDGQTLASGSADDTVRLWDVATRRPIGLPLRGYISDVRSVAFGPGGKMLASGSFDGSVRLWDVATRRLIGAPLAGHGGGVLSVAFGPGGKTLASGSRDDTVRLWDVGARRLIGAPLAGHGGGALSVAFSPDGKTLASGSFDGSVRLWDVATRRPIGAPLTGHKSGVLSVAFSPDGKTLASGSRDDTVRLWDVATRRPIGAPLTGQLNVVLSVAFSPDGRTVISGSTNEAVRSWEVATRQPSRDSLNGSKAVESVAFSPDGKTLAAGGFDGTVRLWDVATRQPIGDPLNGAGSIASTAFSPDGKILATSGADHTIRIWDVAYLVDIVPTLCASTSRSFTRADWQKYIPTGPAYRSLCP